MKSLPRFTSLFTLALCLALSSQSFAGKKFKRALIIAGGSVTPAVGLGIIEALRAQGKAPDVVITTCGSSMASMLLNSYGTPANALKAAQGENFYNTMRHLRLATPHLLTIGKKFNHIEKNQHEIPQIYSSPLLHFPEDFKNWIPNTRMSSGKSGPRFIIQASKALFGPEHVGQTRTQALFQQVYFTDSDTARSLEGISAPIRRLFPNAYVRKDVKVISNVGADQAARASISDPLLLNPAKINGEYYFTGAIDLIPLELAHRLADEVISTYPRSLFEDYENLAIQTSFGFKQSDRVLKAIQDKRVRWIDMTDIENVSLEPKRQMLTFINKVPQNQEKFKNAMQLQYNFGFYRAQEALVSRSHESHLRTPINPRLAMGFTCDNANVWKTRVKKWCTSDAHPGCDRRKNRSCTPIR